MTKRNRVLLPIGIILIGALAVAGMILLQPKAKRAPKERKPTVVEAEEVKLGPVPAVIRSTGVVGASKEITLLPEVGGKIVHVSDQLYPGGRFKKGQLIARIDSRDYHLAMKAEESKVRQAELDLQLAESRQKAAQVEWKLLGDDRPEAEVALALRKPQLETAKENLEAAKSSLEKAKLSLYRTSLRAPFPCVVADENVDLGQLVGSSTTVARLIGTERFWIVASVPVDRLGLIDIPEFNAEIGSAVKIIQSLGGGQQVIREGTVIGHKGILDPQTRTAQLLVALDNPMDPPEGQMPILHGAYVDLEIQGKTMDSVAVIPRKAVIDGKSVWLVDAENKLASRSIEIGWGLEKTAAVTSGLNEGDRIVITKLALPFVGMPVKIQSETSEADAKAEQEENADES